MTTQTQIQMKVRRMTLDLRAINRLVQSEDFLKAWDAASDEERKCGNGIIESLDITGLRQWFHDIRVQDLRDMTHRELLVECQKKQIRNYSRMQKDEMIKALMETATDDRASP